MRIEGMKGGIRMRNENRRNENRRNEDGRGWNERKRKNWGGMQLAGIGLKERREDWKMKKEE